MPLSASRSQLKNVWLNSHNAKEEQQQQQSIAAFGKKDQQEVCVLVLILVSLACLLYKVL